MTRITAGELRGRRLRTAPGRETRPTSERARCGLFDWLGAEVVGARVLDLFAGSGALGIEALSRGASEVVFVERARASLSALRTNLESLDLVQRSRVVSGAVDVALARLARAGERFTLVLADPPYGGAAWRRLATAGALRELVAPGGALILERSARDADPSIPAGFAPAADRRYGETRFDRYDLAVAGKKRDEPPRRRSGAHHD